MGESLLDDFKCGLFEIAKDIKHYFTRDWSELPVLVYLLKVGLELVIMLSMLRLLEKLPVIVLGALIR